MYTVYCHTFPNGKKYIGITKQSVENRRRKGTGYSRQPLMKKAIKKYGWENITHTILFAGLTRKQAEQKEIELIKLYDTRNRTKGYNIEKGGNCGNISHKNSKEYLKKLSNSLKGNQNRTGKKANLETRIKLSKAHKGKKFSELHKLHLSQATRGKPRPNLRGAKNGMYGANRKGKNNPRWGKHDTVETIAKRSRPVLQYDLKGNLIAEYSSIHNAAITNHFNQGDICSCCKGKLKKAKNFVRKYK